MKTRRMMAHLNTLECAAATNVTIASARRANTFFDVEDEEEEEEEEGGGMSSKRTMWCPGEAVSLYDPANAMKGNYKHMAMVETIPWRGPAMGNVLLAWQTSEKIEGTRQRLVIAEAEGKELRFKALTANKQREMFADFICSRGFEQTYVISGF